MKKKEVFRTSARFQQQNCPGSPTASRDISTPSTAVAAAGVRIHTAMEIATKHDYLEAAYHCEDPESFLQQHGAAACDIMQLNSFDAGYVKKAMTEIAALLIEAKAKGWKLLWSQREPSLYADCGEYAFAGHADLVIGFDACVVCADYKTGALDVVETDENAQIHGYARFYADLGLPVRVYILARGNDPFCSFTTLTQEHIAVIVKQMDAEAKACMEHDAPRKTGKWCTYCPAKCTTRCPESTEAMATFERTSIQQRDISAVLQWKPEMKAAWLQRYAVVKKIYEDAYDMLKEDAANGNVPGYTVFVTHPRSVIDMAGLVKALMDEGVAALDIVAASKISMSDLEDLFWNHAKALAKITGEKCAKKDVLDRLAEITKDYVERGERKTLKGTKGDE